LRLGLPRRPPRLHHCRQFLPHSCTHRLATGGLLGDGRTFFAPRFAFLLCPPGLLCSPDSGTCCRAHPATFLGTRWLSLAPVRWPTTSYRLGTRSEEHTSELQSLTNLVCRRLLEQ